MNGEILDKNGNRCFVIDVVEKSPGLYQGTVLESDISPELTMLLSEYENHVNSQVLPLLDEIECKIQSYELYFQQKPMRDLQVMNRNQISFKI